MSKNIKLLDNCIIFIYNIHRNTQFYRKGITMKFSRDFVSGGGGFSDYGNHVPAPYLRKSFVLGKMNSAELTICGLGFYELFVKRNTDI